MYDLLTWWGKDNLDDSKRYHINNQLGLKFSYTGLWGPWGYHGKPLIMAVAKKGSESVPCPSIPHYISYHFTPEIKNEFNT